MLMFPKRGVLLGVRGLSTKESFFFRSDGHLHSDINPLFPQANPPTSQWEKWYCGKLSFEFMHLGAQQEREWLIGQIEQTSPSRISQSQRRNAWTQLKQAQLYEQFMAKKFPAFKRYSGEGTEAMIVAVDQILQHQAKNANPGEDEAEIVIGMPHRGRLALLASVLEYPLHKLFLKVAGQSEYPEKYDVVDDVTSHIGISLDKSYLGQDKVHVSLLHNPSHLEIINSVAMGKVKAKQDQASSPGKRDFVSNKTALLIHGDAAFTGQGCVPESLSLSSLPDFCSDGSIHLVVNNQVGFTTTAPDGRRGNSHVTELAKSFQMPVIHVNAEDIDAVLRSVNLAQSYRKKFGKDVMIDLIGYRRHGHNEVDEPSFTQPKMYKNIRARETFPDAYEAHCKEQGLLTNSQIEKYNNLINTTLNQQFDLYQQKLGVPASELNGFQGNWSSISPLTRDNFYKYLTEQPDTGVCMDTLQKIGEESVNISPDHQIHDRLLRSHVKPRLAALSSQNDKKTIDWATAEALAFGSLCTEGSKVRLSGQDCKRGTFSHRHLGFVDQTTNEYFFPLSEMVEKKLQVVNSNLSELAVMGFEYGYSWESPQNIVCWEAQFGDFNNGAQIIIDQFLACGESKWMRQSGLVLLLPHGYDHAGPDHSSCKPERFLQMIDTKAQLPMKEGTSFLDYVSNVNMLIVNATTPAQYFHVLRRQQMRSFRKPLILFTPKTLLRSPLCLSSLEEMDQGTHFKPILTEKQENPEKIKRVLLCSGKFYYDLASRRQDTDEIDTTTIIRLEELSPFPFHLLQEALAQYGQLEEVIWVQEEPVNQGAWSYVRTHMEKLNVSLGYIGRKSIPASAVGMSSQSKQETNDILQQVFPL